MRPFVLLPPSEIISTFLETPGFYLEATLITAWHLGLGLAISLALSLAVGALLAAFRPLEHASQPLLVLILVTPWVAYINSVVLFVGRGNPSIIFLVSFVTVPAFVYAIVSGMRSADPAARELFASVDATRWEVLWRLRLPSAVPVDPDGAADQPGARAWARPTSPRARSTAWATAWARSANGRLPTTRVRCCGPRSSARRCSASPSRSLVVVVERWLLHWHASQRRVGAR